MKYITYRKENELRVGVMSAAKDVVYPLPYQDMLCLIRDAAQGKVIAPQGDALPLTEVELLAPIPSPLQDVICMGVNYTEHARESTSVTSRQYDGREEPAIYFSKRVNEAVAPYGCIDSHSDIVQTLDYEVELAAVLGRDARDVPPEQVREYIFGYMVLNDVSARAMQRAHKQWYRGKSLDGFTPMGPWIVTADEIAYPPALDIECCVNGQVRQSGNTGDMIRDLTAIVSELSCGMTLKAGTIIATGTPSGVAMGMAEPNYLKPGDVVECTIAQIGTIRNTVK